MDEPSQDEADENQLLELLERAKSGDKDAEVSLAKEIRTHIHRTLRPMGASAGTRSDLSQETALSVFRKLETCRASTDSQVRAWFFTIAKRLLIRKRKTKKNAHLQSLSEASEPVDKSNGDGNSLENKEILYLAIALLEPEDQQLVITIVLDDIPRSQVAESLGISCRTLDKRLQRAMERLRIAMEQLNN